LVFVVGEDVERGGEEGHDGKELRKQMRLQVEMGLFLYGRERILGSLAGCKASLVGETEGMRWF